MWSASVLLVSICHRCHRSSMLLWQLASERSVMRRADCVARGLGDTGRARESEGEKKNVKPPETHSPHDT